MSLMQIIAALLLFAFGVAVMVRRWPMRWCAALFCGVAAFWMWSIAFALTSFVKGSAGMGPFGSGDPRAAASAVGDALIGGGGSCLLCLPLLIGSAIAFFVDQEPR